MNRDEALAVLDARLERYPRRPHAELAEMLGNQGCDEVVATSGAAYQIEVDIVWDGKPGGDLRVMGGIDDGGLSFFSPLSQSFVMSTDGTIR